MDFITAVLIFAATTCLPFLSYIMAPNPPILRGIYREPGRTYYFKYLFMYIVITLKKLTNGLRKPKTAGEGSGYGATSAATVEELDDVHVLPKDSPDAVDAVYFVGCNRNKFAILASAARRHNGLVQSAFELIIPEVGTLLHPKFPDTSFNISPADESGQWHVDGLTLDPVEPGRHWRLRYRGKMRLLPTNFVGSDVSKSSQFVDVEMDVDWTANSDLINFDTALATGSSCDGIAREPWSREYFDKLKLQHQTHLEQFGEAKCTIKVEGFGEFNPLLQTVRDRTFGKHRDWSAFHRYSINYLFCEDGSSVSMANICYPGVMSHLTYGFNASPIGRVSSLPTCDIDLARIGEEETSKPGMTGMTSRNCFGRVSAEAKIFEVWSAPAFYIGRDRCALITDCFVSGSVNGKPMWGVMEWMNGYTGPNSSRKEPYTREQSE